MYLSIPGSADTAEGWGRHATEANHEILEYISPISPVGCVDAVQFPLPFSMLSTSTFVKLPQLIVRHLRCLTCSAESAAPQAGWQRLA